MLRILHKKYILIILLVSILLTVVWFRNGYLMGGGETGLPFYNLNQMFKISGWTWGNQALGNNDSLTVSSGPFFAFFSFFQNLGISGFVLQAVFYFGILFFTLYSIFKLTDTLFPDLQPIFKLFASFFYLFNLYSLMNVWNRNLPNTIVFYALLPLLLAIFIQGLKKEKYIFAVYATILTAIFSYAFGAPAQVIIYWFVIFVTAIFYFFFVKSSRFIIKFLILHFPLWIIFNFWWVSQEIYFRLSSAFSASVAISFSDYGNKSTFDILSLKLGQLDNLFLLKHGTFFTNENIVLPFSWPLFFSQPLTLALQWLVILLILFVAIRKIKDKQVGFLLTFFIIGIFATKGNADPFGEIFDYLFSNFPFLQFFRNPFEKLGLLLPMSLAPLFGLTVFTIHEFLRKKSRFLSVITSLGFLIYLFIFIGFFFWTKLVFTSNNPPANDPSIGYDVQPPDYYAKANEWLSRQNGIFRFVTFPLGGEGIFNQWPKGYAGIELSGTLFTTPSISYITTIPYFAETVQKLEKLFLKRSDFYKIAALLNARYILLRPDINQRVASIRDPKTIEKVLDERIASPEANLKLANSFGPLKFYQFNENVFLPKLYAANNVIRTNKSGNMEDFFNGFGEYKDIIIQDKKGENNFQDLTKTTILHRQGNFFLSGPTELLFSKEPAILPYADRIPFGLTSELINLSERFSELSTQNIDKKAMYKIMLLGKRLVEAQIGIQRGNPDSVVNSILLYQKAFPQLFSFIQNVSISSDQEIKIWRPDYLAVAFGTHLTLLKEFDKTAPKDSELSKQIQLTEKLIYDKLIALKVFSYFRPIVADNFPISSRFIYQFSVEKEGEYEIIIPETNLDKYFNIPSKMLVQTDDKVSSIDISHNQQGQISLGKFQLSANLHEIGLNLLPGINLVDESDQFTIRAIHDDQKEEKKLPLKNFDPYSQYQISLDYYVRSGTSPKLSLLQNNDKFIKGKQVPRVENERNLPMDNYWFDFRNFVTSITPDGSADFAQLYLTVDPWNDCQQLFQHGWTHLRCLEPEFKKSFDRVTEAYVKNVKLSKISIEDPILRKIESHSDKTLSPTIDFRKIDQTKYLVSIKNSQAPFVLVFSELFNSDWKAYLTKNNITEQNNMIWETWMQKPIFDDKHFLVNSYANGWLINKQGDFNIIIEFWPQRLLYVGYFVSGLTIMTGLVFITWSKLRRRSDENDN